MNERNLAIACALFVAGCLRGEAENDSSAGRALEAADASVESITPAEPLAAGDEASIGADAEARRADAVDCPAGMVLVSGEYCPEAVQTCLEHHPEWERNHAVSERCLRFAEPSVCASKARVPMRFCVDRYEWPNEKDAIPTVLVDWNHAKSACASVGKRLCTEDEWNFACEGEGMLPHVYGYERDATKCNIDKPYRARRGRFRHYDKCMADPECALRLHAIDQRAPSGSFAECVSPFGAFDMNGNVNEWVELPGEKAPNRSGLKGGWWGPVRNRCRPTVTFHKEEDYGYEAGFRCCADANVGATR